MLPMAGGVLLPDQAEEAQILFPDRFVEVVGGAEVAFDFRRRGRAFAIERAAGRQMHQRKRQRADDQQQRHGEQEAAEEIHAISQ